MPTNPDRRIKLTMSTQSNFASNQAQGFRLVVEASNGNLMPNEVFLYLHKDPSTGFPDGEEVFQTICTVPQLTLPVDAPATGSSSKLYRTASADITFRTIDAATDAWALILEAVEQLKAALDYNDGLTLTDFWIGTPA